MMHKILRYQKTLAGILIVSLVSVIFPFAALAQTSVGASAAGGQAGAGLTSLVQDTTGAIAAAAIACEKAQIHSGIQSLFGKGTTVAPAVSSAAASTSGQPVTDAQLGSTGALSLTLTQIAANTSKTSAATQAQVTKTTCTNAIEKAAAGVILRQLTVSTVNWINHGLNGNPFYSTNTASALQSIANTTIKQLNSVIGLNSLNYPFGKSVAQSITQALGSSFEQQAQYSLNNVIAQQYPGMTNADFQNSFGIGGWDAFLAQTAFNNNPFGFAMTTQNVVGSRLAGTSYSPAQDLKAQLAQSGGFFSQKVCVDPNYNPSAGNVNALTASDTAAQNAATTANAAYATANNQYAAAEASGDEVAIEVTKEQLQATSNALTQANAKMMQADSALSNGQGTSVCNKYTVQTPGSIIGSSLSKALGANTDSLVNGQDLSTDITAIFNALSNQLINKGLSSLSTAAAGTNNGTSNTFSNNSNGTVANNATPASVTPDGTWASAGQNFNVFTDIPSVIRYEDNPVGTTVLGTGCEPGELFNPSDNQLCAADPTRPEGYQQIIQKEIDAQNSLVTDVYELDYCIPGPHPGVIDNIESNAESFVSNPNLFPASDSASDVHKLLSSYGSSVGSLVGLGLVVTFAATGAFVGSAVPGLGTVIGVVVGAIVGVVLTAIGNNNNNQNEDVYGGYMNTVMGLEFNYHQDTNNGDGKADLNGHDNTANIITTLAQRYQEAMQMVYEPTQADVQAAMTAATANPNGTSTTQGIGPGAAPTVTGQTAETTTTAPFIPDLSTSNAARLAITKSGANAFTVDISDLTALDQSEFPQIQTLEGTISQDQADLASSKAVEAQLENLLSKIGTLPEDQGYPGLTGTLGSVPVITLNGPATMQVNVNDPFVDPGATAVDGPENSDGGTDISSAITTVSNVNTAVAGVYTVTYDVTDSIGIAANQATRTVDVVDPITNDAGPVVPNSAVANPLLLSAQANSTGLTAASLTTSTSVPVRDYNKDLQAIVNVTDVSQLNQYEDDLRQIYNTFQQLAPYIHGVDDLNNEEAALDSINNGADAIAHYNPGTSQDGMPDGGSLKECIKATTYPGNPGYVNDGGPDPYAPNDKKTVPPYIEDGGPTGRVAFSWIANDGSVASLPAWLLAAVPPQMSFLPNWHFAQANGVVLVGKNWFPDDGEAAYPAGENNQQFLFSDYDGDRMASLDGATSGTSGPVTLDFNKLIRNDDVAVINKQPIIDAMKGLEHVVSMY